MGKRIALLFALLLGLGLAAFAQRPPVWVDADTGNEIDDLYALVRLLNEPGLNLVSLSSAHFNNADVVAFSNWNQDRTANMHTVNISQQLNEELLRTMGRLAVPHPLGADRQMGRAWGGREPRDSPAARQLIAAVKQLPARQKLAVVCLGALTNVASAIALDTSIARQLTCYALGARYNLREQYWNKSEFNIRNDLNAFDSLLDNPLVELVVMPLEVAQPYRFKRDSLYAQLNSAVSVQRLLRNRWQETEATSAERTLWDLALVEAFLKPQFSTTTLVRTPPENTRRTIRIYTHLQEGPLRKDFMDNLKTIH